MSPRGGIVLVDSNVILGVVTGNAVWSGWSSEALSRAANESRLAINVIVAP